MYKETALICVRYASDPIISASFQLHGSGREDTSVGSKAQRILQGNTFTARLQGSIKRLILVVAPGDPASNGARLELSGPLVHFPSLAKCSHATLPIASKEAKGFPGLLSAGRGSAISTSLPRSC
jgi:hypothetical protein